MDRQGHEQIGTLLTAVLNSNPVLAENYRKHKAHKEAGEGREDSPEESPAGYTSKGFRPVTADVF